VHHRFGSASSFRPPGVDHAPAEPETCRRSVRSREACRYSRRTYQRRCETRTCPATPKHELARLSFAMKSVDPILNWRLSGAACQRLCACD